MKRHQFLSCLAAVSVFLLQPTLVLAAKIPPSAVVGKGGAKGNTAVQSYPVPIPPEIAANAYLLIDVSANGQVLAEKNADKSVEPASLTKLMTAYLVFEALKNKRLSLEQKLTVSERARAAEGSRMFIDVGWQVPVEDLLKGLIVQSGNDAANVLAEGVGGSLSNFVQMMNNKAQELGMKGTHYQNAEGLTVQGHYTTAHDLAVLAQRLLQDFPQYTGFYAIKKYRYPGTPLSNDTNRNTLLFRDPSVDGLKTGHTAAAGYCLVSTAKREYAGIGGRRLVSIILGAASDNVRAAESQKLLNWGFVAYQPVKLFAGGTPVSTPPIYKGSSSTVALGLSNDIVVAVPAGTAGQVSTAMSRPDPLIAPVRKGQRIGILQISVAGRPFMNLPMEALQDVSQAGWFGRGWDAVRLWVQ